MPILENFCGPSFVSQSVEAAAEACTNWYVEAIESPSGGKGQARFVLYPTPGFESFATLTQSPCFGLFESFGRVFAVGGHVLDEIDAGGTVTNRGNVNRDGNPAHWAHNDEELKEMFFTVGKQGYLFDLDTNTLTNPVSDVTHAGFVDGYFFALNADAQLIISALRNGTSWSAVDFGRRTKGADPPVSLLTAHGDVWLLGRLTTEVWYNSGATFAFEPIPGAFLQEGTAAPYSPAIVGNRVAWLGSSRRGQGTVWMADGYTPKRISTHAVETAIGNMLRDASIADAEGWSYESDGHMFYGLTFPTGNQCWVYDATTNLWHERAYWDPVTRRFVAYRPRGFASTFQRQLVGDRRSGTLYSMDRTFGSDMDSNELRRLRRSPHLSVEDKTIFLHELEIDLERGLGIVSGQGSDPQVMIKISRDGGKTYGNEMWASAGQTGEYDARVIFRRLGRGRRIVIEMTVADPAPYRVVRALFEATAGLH